MSDYSPEAFEMEECSKYRSWPECKGMSDRQIYDLTHETVDDMDDAGWRILFKTRGKVNLSVIRETFEGVKGRSLNMTDEVLVLVLERAGKVWQDFIDNEDEASAIAFLEKAETEAAKQSAAVADIGILALVAKIDDTFEAEITACLDATIKAKVTAVHFYAEMKRVFTKEELDTMPIPGTEAGHVTGNAKPDKVKTVDNKGNPITTVWWNDFVSATARGKAFENQIADVAAELKTRHSVKHLANLKVSELEDLKADALSRRNALRNMYKRASGLHHQLEAIKAMPLVGIKWVKSRSDNAIRIPDGFGTGSFDKAVSATGNAKPLWIWPGDDVEAGGVFSVTQVLNFDIPAAIEAGGTMADLVASGKASGGDNDSDDTTEVMTPDKRDTDFIELHAHLKMRDNMAAFRKTLNEPDQDELKDSVCSLFLLLKPIYLAHQAWYEKKNEMPHEDVA